MQQQQERERVAKNRSALACIQWNLRHCSKHEWGNNIVFFLVRTSKTAHSTSCYNTHILLSSVFSVRVVSTLVVAYRCKHSSIECVWNTNIHAYVFHFSQLLCIPKYWMKGACLMPPYVFVFRSRKKAINVGCIPGALTSPTPSSLASLCCMQISIARGVPVLIVSPQNMLHIQVAEKWLRLHYFCAPHCWSINHAQRVSEYFFSFLIFFIILCMIYKYITPAIATRLWAKALRYQPFCIQQNGWPCGACEHFLIGFPQSLSLWHFSWEGFECGDVACLSRKWQT